MPPMNCRCAGFAAGARWQVLASKINSSRSSARKPTSFSSPTRPAIVGDDDWHRRWRGAVGAALHQVAAIGAEAEPTGRQKDGRRSESGRCPGTQFWEAAGFPTADRVIAVGDSPLFRASLRTAPAANERTSPIRPGSGRTQRKPCGSPKTVCSRTPQGQSFWGWRPRACRKEFAAFGNERPWPFRRWSEVLASSVSRSPELPSRPCLCYVPRQRELFSLQLELGTFIWVSCSPSRCRFPAVAVVLLSLKRSDLRWASDAETPRRWPVAVPHLAAVPRGISHRVNVYGVVGRQFPWRQLIKPARPLSRRRQGIYQGLALVMGSLHDCSAAPTSVA